ncbi:MAG: serine/threonine-protein kinase [Polyangiaceae bacterium]
MVVTDDVVQRVQSRVGMTISDKWRLTRVLGIGGMAAVYAAVHRNQNRVAIKMLHPEQSLNETVRTRFLREGYVANTVEHPGAVRVFDDGVVDGAAYLVMELLEGESLEDRRDRLGGRLPIPDVLAICDQVLDALAAAHDKGIVHRDIKPDNLFLTTDGAIKVLDFGIARLREFSQPGGTTAGTFMGTPSFMSPEQARGRWEEVDARSDVWSTGATLFYLLTGRLVHAADTFADQLALAAREPAPPIAEVDPEQPLVVAEIVDRALAYRSANRWQSARSMQQAVRAARRMFGPPRTGSIRAELDPPAAVGENQTLLATPEVTTSSQRERRTSASAVAVLARDPSAEAAAESRQTRTRLLIAGAALLLALFVLGGLRYSQKQRAEEAATSNSASAIAAATFAAAPAPIVPATSLAPSAAPSAPAVTPPAQSASASPAIAVAAGISAPIAGRAVRTETRLPARPAAPTPSAAAKAAPLTSAAPPPTATSRVGAGNLLDKRF